MFSEMSSFPATTAKEPESEGAALEVVRNQIPGSAVVSEADTSTEVLEEVVVEKASPVVQEVKPPVVKEVVSETPVSYLGDELVIKVEKASAVNDFRVSNLFDSLGIKAESGKDIKVMQLKKSTVKPLPGIEVKDTSGRVSEIINDYQKQCGITIVPVEITNIPNWVTPKVHGVFELNGSRYFYPLSPSDSQQRIDEFIDNVMKDLKEGKVVKRSMFKEFEYEKVNYRTLLFTQSEMSDVTTLLSNFGANLFVIGNEDILLVAGDYIYG
jgi:hypothetical protein